MGRFATLGNGLMRCPHGTILRHEIDLQQQLFNLFTRWLGILQSRLRSLETGRLQSVKKRAGASSSSFGITSAYIFAPLAMYS